MNSILHISNKTSMATVILLLTCQQIFAIDSVQVIIDQDTLYYPAISTIDFPAYQIFSDSGQTAPDKTPLENGTGDDSEITAKGSISRGIQVSSNASVSLQSSLYLKISGDLGENYAVDGVLTERTSPLQPIGNTRRLNDFDRVLVTISGPSLTASIGDIDLDKDHGKFGRFKRSIEGIDASARSGQLVVDGSVGFSYGQYTVQQIQGSEGKQGPYRLEGKNGEKFIIILAGSEKVELDGHRLERGDYIIDYNAAELSFSPAYMISNNSRISVDFEYVPDVYLANYSFGRRLISAGTSMGERHSTPLFFSASVKQLSDDGSNPLGSIDQPFLESVFEGLPDTVASTWVSTVLPDSVEGDYQYNSGVLVYTGPSLGTHRASFNFVGLDLGEYRKDLSGGLEFYIYDPTAGEYLPAQKLISPQSQSVFTFSGGYAGKLLKASADFGVSRNIRNLYASGSQGVDRLAWDANLGLDAERGAILVGQKNYEQGFTTFELMESNEYYRRWKLSPRVDEQERLDYASLRVGNLKHLHAAGEASQLIRSDRTIGQQANLNVSNDPNNPYHVNYGGLATRADDKLSHQHSIRTGMRKGKYYAQVHGSLEDGLGSIYFENNDHVASGVSLQFDPSQKHKITTTYDLRRDYRQLEEGESLIDPGVLQRWTDQRTDMSAQYGFQHDKNAHAKLALKYRQHENDSSGISTYTLGNLDLGLKGFDGRVNYSGRYSMDEEHIPKYDFQYVLVDTGYGEYSYDPITRDYLPVNGGRFIRQRVFSDHEEQVRKMEGKTNLEYASKQYHDRTARGLRIGGQANNQKRSQVNSGDVIQRQDMLRITFNYRLGEGSILNELYYTGRNTQRFSSLYNFGNESSDNTTHDLYGILSWNPSNRTKIGGLAEKRTRDIEYNPLAIENWLALRPYGIHTFTISSKQRVEGEIKYSLISDVKLEQVYTESYIELSHRFRVGRRGSVDQQAYISYIQSESAGIPYSVFSGRQPGQNWKYTFNGRYVFSNRFQISLNYSIQERGESAVEQYMRIEGRTHF